MTVVTNGGVDLYYEARGDPRLPEDADRAADTVVFVEPAGYGAWVWGWQHAALAEGFETVTWDLRGTGRSDAPEGPYEVRTLAGDLEAVLADHGVADAHVVGAGLGGMIALEYADRYTRAASLTLFGTAASGDRVDADALESLFAPRDDPGALRASLRNAFAADVDAHADVVDEIVGWRREEDADRTGFDAQTAAMRSFDRSDSLYEITTPARVYHGVDDAVVPTDAGRDLAEGLPRGEFTAVEGGHLCFIEESAAVNDALLGDFEDAA
ncbi:alpha/beta fold hydrolase [Halosimplex rubrum]|uniref:Alpha/beta fold hydrolase n=1 Tax=Halosimplex rubrum TaxID=869889 RepID=A0A7D5TLU7_9EURY|nr:alpha/beta hydrolase [Halosimplex rubrum]QLH76134.1 alpha/beta fold hydrolase [Halosimplex rubrum]